MLFWSYLDMKIKKLGTFVLTMLFIMAQFAIAVTYMIQRGETPHNETSIAESKLSFASSQQKAHESQKPAVAESKQTQSLSEPQPLLSIDQSIDGIGPNGLITLKLIDISYRTVIHDWNSVKNNVDGIYMKATEGTTYTDPLFNSNAKAATNAKIPIGFYHYFWPRSNPEYAKEQADYFYNAIKKYKYEFYPVLDIEKTNGQNAKTIIANVKAFLEEFQKVAHQKLMFYCSPNFANNYLNDKGFASLLLWIANYNVNAPRKTIIWSTFDVWQYGINITVPGVSGDVDGDIATNDIFIDKNSAPKM